MGNIFCSSCLFRRAGYKDEVQESGSPAVDTITTADSSEPHPNESKENSTSFLDNLISALRYLYFDYMYIYIYINNLSKIG